jgi:hypothetical protein
MVPHQTIDCLEHDEPPLKVEGAHPKEEDERT